MLVLNLPKCLMVKMDAIKTRDSEEKVYKNLKVKVEVKKVLYNNRGIKRF